VSAEYLTFFIHFICSLHDATGLKFGASLFSFSMSARVTCERQVGANYCMRKAEV
jgi:hypothetical protein